MRRLLYYMTRHPLSLAGTTLTTASATLILIIAGMQLVGMEGSPYVGILAYLVLPAFFILGLVLIPIGVRRADLARKAKTGRPRMPVIDFNRISTQRTMILVLTLTVVNVTILAVATYKGVEVMDSTEFCGTACHSVMSPEYTAYVGSPHAKVACVECHIGSGAGWYAKSKLSGAWQVVSTTFDLYPRPIPTPIENLRPARETCEQCHWPTKFHGDKLDVRTRFQPDAENTETKTVLLLRVGGVDGEEAHGIHWHIDPRISIRYRSDPTRETIYEVELTDESGNVTVFEPPEPAPEGEGEALTWRVMDCVDCHNRPTHIYGQPPTEIDAALAEGRLDRSLPYLKREGVRALRASYDSHEAAREGIREQLVAFYRDQQPDTWAASQDAVLGAADVLGDIWSRNVFPSMNVTWGTYPTHIGHEVSDGCFRCHDEEHTAAGGEVISQDCSTCHSLLAMEEQDPEILTMIAGE